jgi:Pyruvate/2-oxoacid:ferredoxin oxidoreductase gamma subunit
LLSVLVKLTGIVKLESLENAVKDTLKGKPDMVEKNLNALKDAYTKVNNW